MEFRDVSFRYPTRQEVLSLNQVSLTLQPGRLVALVGLSGSGKSTLVALLQRLYDSSDGTVGHPQGVELAETRIVGRTPLLGDSEHHMSGLASLL